ncbi:MAG: ferritin-like domain-containing protein, partial [Methanosarcinaceae archaeon]|nr:ferritin-like domain-containing protein [Methanosarcinaceae archaeon]
PTQKPSAILRGGDLKKMVSDNLGNENAAIKQYKEHIKLASEAGDPTTRLMLEEILSDEERHADEWETILGIKK